MVLWGLFSYGSAFAQDFASNWLSTFLGIIVGIPVALWLSKYQEEETEKWKKFKVIALIKGELQDNQLISSDLRKLDNTEGYSYLYIALHDEIWRSVNNSGDIQWIKDPFVIGSVSDVYATMRIIRETSDRYYNIKLFDNRAAEKTYEDFANMLTNISCQYDDMLTEALQVIDQRVRI